MFRYLAALVPVLLLAVSSSHAADDVATLIDAVRKAPHAERRAHVAKLINAGPEALSAVRKARDGAPAGAVKDALTHAARWILAEELTTTLRAAIESQLTYDGQYDGLKSGPSQDPARGEETVEALLALIDDESVAGGFRFAAVRAIADVGDKRLLPRLRRLHSDLLLHPTLREEIGVVLAVFGETHAVESDIRTAKRYVTSTRVDVRLRAHVELARLYYRIRDYKKAIESYEQIVQISRQIYDAQKGRLPESAVRQLAAELAIRYYNAACSNTLGGELDRAKKYLREAIRLNPEHYASIEKDGDLIELRQHPTYPAFKKALGALFEDDEL